MLNIEHLTKAYGEKKAVDDLSLHIVPGEIYGFIGHNGAGKTTTLKSVAGILQFDVGEITIGKNCWLGAGCTILKDVHIGNNVVVAAGSVVTKDVPNGSVVAGIPARKIK